MNLYEGLLFQSGHIADAKLAISLAQSDATAPASSGNGSAAGNAGPSIHQIAARRLARATAFIESVRWLAEELVVLGGRPVSRDQLDDLEEPFPTLHPCH